MAQDQLRDELNALNAAICAELRRRFTSGEATEEDIENAVEFLAVNYVRRGGRKDPFK